MFQQNLVACVKVNGQILRESGDLVTLPFGCEYSILVKNLNSVRAQIGISVDGKDATDGTKLIIAPNSSVELERFIKNGNLQVGNRLKFIERTTEIEGHRGVGSDDGLIRVEAWKEHVQEFVPIPRYHDQWISRPYPQPWWPYYGPHYTLGNLANTRNTTGQATSGGIGQAHRGIIRGMNFAQAGTQNSQSVSPDAQINFCSASMDSASVPAEQPVSDAGITVPGSQSQQQFAYSSGFQVQPQSVVIVLRLRGEVAGKPVSQPVTVDRKVHCETCGRSNKSDAQYCSKCGTALVLYA